MKNEIMELEFNEIEEVNGAWIAAAGLAVAIITGLVYLGGEYHDATCTDH